MGLYEPFRVVAALIMVAGVGAALSCGQARAENAFFRYKSTVGDRVRARHPEAREVEVVVACNILNRLTELGRAESYAIGA